MTVSAKNALEAVLEARAGDRLLIVTDSSKRTIAGAFERAARELGLSSEIYELVDERRPYRAVPEELLGMLHDGIVLNLFSALAEETPFRVALVRSEVCTGARVGHAPGITETMMVKGPMNVDYGALAELADRLIESLSGAKMAHVTAPGGTDITLDIGGRAFQTDLRIGPHTFGNLPAGEIWCGPVEDGANGTVVCDGSIGDLGQVPAPVRITVRDGRIDEIRCTDRNFLDRVNEALSVDGMAKVIGELGLGLNPGARITGNLLEDEKAGKTAHVAFGNNLEMPGGRNDSATHRDFLFHRPTIEITYENGHRRVLVRDGELQT